MKLRAIAVLAALVIGTMPAAAQTKPATLRGRVTAADTGRPLRRAQISLIPVAGQARRVLGPSTNSQGRFELTDVPPGTYYVSASRAGYIDLQHGQRRPGESGLAIEVKEGRTVERIDIALPKGSVITGRLSDELGEPYPGIRVNAFQLRYTQGRRIPYPSGSAVTDDLGEFRIADLVPGTYYVGAASAEMWRNEKKETMAYAATYFSGTALGVPQAVTLGVSQERTGVDFSLTAARAARVTGRVLKSTGEPMPSEPVSLAYTVRGASFVMTNPAPVSVRTQADGSFEYREVPPADYSLRAGSRGESASTFLSVSGDVENVVLVTRSGSTVAGSVITDQGVAPPFPASGIRLALIAPDENVLPTVRFPAVNNDWTFRLTSMGGPFLFRVNGLPAGWMLDAVKLGERDITDTPWDVPTGGRDLSGLELVITKEASTLDGSVSTFAGKPTNDATVVIFSEEAERWMPGSRFVRMARPNAEGQFSIAGLPAGSYFAVAKDFIEEGQWEDKEFLESVRSEAVRVTLTRGGSETVSLKLPAVR